MRVRTQQGVHLPAARFTFGEAYEKPGQIDHAVAFVENDHTTRTHDGADCSQRIDVYAVVWPATGLRCAPGAVVTSPSDQRARTGSQSGITAVSCSVNPVFSGAQQGVLVCTSTQLKRSRRAIRRFSQIRVCLPCNPRMVRLGLFTPNT